MKNECDHCHEPIIGREADRLHPNGPLPVTVVLGRKAMLFCSPLHARNFLEDLVRVAFGEEREQPSVAWGTTELEANEGISEN